MTTFNDFALDPQLLANVAALGFDAPTPIQAEAIPRVLEGSDVIARARTGSGKTAAFALPMVQNLISTERRGTAVRALVLAPTRELALQITSAIDDYTKKLSLRVATIYGGAPYGPQLKALRRGADVVVGTPGRVLDHLSRGALDLSALELLVLDEADEMLNMGFLEDVEAVLEASPEGRQVTLFSATMPPEIQRVAKKYLSSPIEVQVEERALTTDHIAQTFVVVPPAKRLDALERILAARPPGATLVFARTRAECAELADQLAKRGSPVDAMHGDLNQAARERVLTRLRSRRLDVVIATDVASRGIDVDHLTLVVNLELPRNPELYVHRIGRTGRAGRAGEAISFVTPREVSKIHRFAKILRADIKERLVPSDAEIQHAKRELLTEKLIERASEAPPSELERWREVLRDRIPDLERAALTLLAEEHGVELHEQASAKVPSWARDQTGRDDRGRDRGKREASEHRERAPRGDRDNDAANAVTLFLATGASRGVRPGDLVGAITNEFSITSAHIGRIRVLPHKSFVSVTEEAAAQIFAEGRSIAVRGKPIKIDRAREFEEGDDPFQERDFSRGRAKKPFRPKGKSSGGKANFGPKGGFRGKKHRGR